MRSRRPTLLLLVAGLVLTGCGQGGGRRPHRPRGPAIAPAGTLNAGGEPQWSAQVRGDQLRFSTGETSAVSVKAGLADHGKAGAAWSGPLAAVPGQPPGVLRLTAVAKSCVDAPTGMTYPFTATVEVGGHRYTGCAAPAGQGLGPRS
ncbi:hypothetical protein [Caulobacter sp. S45]|uniref:hypothetical protein n=1 Tax=Caulobacter sp. S45 TaxID=1641861 RepID=UPI001576B096|nr:hypothetical protein [Caulobacter sp. S45]